MDEAALVLQLANLTGRLSATADTPPDALDSARRQLAEAILNAQRETIGTTTADEFMDRAAEDLSEATGDALRRVARDAMAAGRDASLRLFRRSWAVLANHVQSSVPPWGRGWSVESIGPFGTPDGGVVWFDTRHTTAAVLLRASATNRPLIRLPAETLAGTGDPFSTSVLEIPPGSVWLAATLFDANALAGSFAGLRIRGGTVTFSNAAAVQGRDVHVDAGVVVTLEFRLDVPTPRRAVDGGDARDVTVNLPERATFALHAGTGARLEHVAPATFEIYGQKMHLRDLGVGPARYDSRLAGLWFPLSPDRGEFVAISAASTMLRPRGNAAIQSAGWVLPVAVPHAGDPLNLGDAGGAGAVSLSLGAGLEATITPVSTSAPMSLDSTVLLVEPGQLAVLADASSPRYRHRLDLWDDDRGRRSRVDLQSRDPLTVGFDSTVAHGGAEALTMSPLECDAHVDRPVTAAGKPVPFASRRATCELQRFGDEARVALSAPADPPSDPVSGQPVTTRECSFALSNAFVRASSALTARIAGVLDGDHQIAAGSALLRFALRFVLPTLPDPYAANLARHAPRREADAVIERGAQLRALVNWTSTTRPHVSFDLSGDQVALSSALLPIEDPPIEREPRRERNLLPEVEARFSHATGPGPEAFRLLDVSSRADLFGVGAHVGRRTVEGRDQSALRLRGMELIASTRNVTAFTLPAFQWEPVYDLPAEGTLPFPRKLISPTDGGPTRFATPAATLVPVAPLPVVDTLIEEYNRPDGVLVARFTLPFGIVSVAELRRHAGLPQLLFAPPHFGRVRPDFASAGVSGGLQLTLRPGGPVIKPVAGPSPGLSGAAVQTDNAATPHNVLKSGGVDDMFNATFAAAMPMVPVQRIDVSGYGASTFSDWRHPDVTGAGVTQVKFEALVGRTSREVVQVKSRLYPWGAILVRIITIERTGSGGVFRRDSGWQAASDGTYDLPGCVVHPGVVPRLTRIRRIRDTTGEYERAYGPGVTDTVKLTQVVFDADVEIEGVTLGTNTDRLVPCHDLVGYVQVLPVGVDLTATQVDDLLASTGSVGGPIDCELNVAQSGLHMRLSRIEVDRTATIAGNPQFVALARGTAEMPTAGQWTFAYRGQSEPEPHQLAADRPVPLIRANPVAGVVQPYRFADARELHRVTNPDSEYGLLQATGAQRLLVPQPQLRWGEAIVHGGAPLLFADMYALAGGVALFPRTDRCHPLPAGTTLRITGRKKVRLDIPQQPGLGRGEFGVGPLERTLSHTASMRMRSRFRGDSRIKLVVDSDQRPDWSCSYGPVTLLADIGDLEELTQVVGTVTSSSEEAAQLRNPFTVFGGPLAPVQDIIGFLSGFGLPFPFEVSITNAEFGFKSGWKYLFPDYAPAFLERVLEDGLGVVPDIELVGRWGKESKSAEVIGKEISSHSLVSTKGIPKGPDKHNWHFIFECEASIEVECFQLTRLIQLFLQGAMKIEIGGEEEGKTKLTCLFGFGGAVDVDLGDIIGVKGGRTYYLGFRHLIGAKQVAIGGASEWEVEGELLAGLASVKVSFELMAMVEPANNYKFKGTGTIGIDVTLGWVLSKEFEVEITADEDMAKGLFVAMMVLP